MKKIDAQWMYKRILGSDSVEKLILEEGKLVINPVKPLNTPKEITQNLFIEFEKMLLLAAGARKKIFLTFPIEIGVFISDKRSENHQLLDVLTLSRQKFTLYGSVSNGLVCKYWKSKIHSVAPSLNPLHEGLMELTMRNTTSDWVSISKVVFSAYGMKLYYDSNVFMKARMDILSKNTAETGFELHHINGNLKSYPRKNQDTWKEALEVYIRKLDFVPPTFDMRLGL